MANDWRLPRVCDLRGCDVEYSPARPWQRFCSDMHRYLARGRLIRLDVTEPEVEAVTDPDDPKSRKFNRILSKLEALPPGQYIDRVLLSHVTGIDDRRMRSAIEWARRDGWPILSQSVAPGGYRLAVSHEDAAPLAEAYHRRAMSMLLTQARLKHHMGKRLHPIQATFSLNGGDENG